MYCIRAARRHACTPAVKKPKYSNNLPAKGKGRSVEAGYGSVVLIKVVKLLLRAFLSPLAAVTIRPRPRSSVDRAIPS